MDTKSFHLEGQPASEGILRGVAREGEFHESSQSASQVLLAGVAPTREIHLKQQPAPEGILEGGVSEGEFHEPRWREQNARLSRVEGQFDKGGGAFVQG